MEAIRNNTRQNLPLPGPRTVVFLIILVFIGCASGYGQTSNLDVDLGIVGTLSLHPLLPNEGDDVQIGVLVENRGLRDAQDVSVYFYEDDVHFEKETVDIRAGDTIYVESLWTADSGNSYLSVTVDPAGDFKEDKSDNSVGIWVTVR
jgi:hypothetical protein